MEDTLDVQNKWRIKLFILENINLDINKNDTIEKLDELFSNSNIR